MSKRRNCKDILLLYCPFCALPVAQADETAQSGFSKAHERGKVNNRGNHMFVKCGECGETWLCALLRFRGWEPGQQLGASADLKYRKPGKQPCQIAVENARPEPEADEGTDTDGPVN